jgi:membrane protease YdiL (CAAX protease family)
MARDHSWFRLLLLTALWLAAARLLPLYGIYLIPLSLARQMTLQTYLMIMQVLTTAFGLGLAALLLRALRPGLGLQWPPAYQLMLAAAAAPLVFVAASYLGIGAAFRTLMEELARGGAEVSKQNAGEFGRALKQDPALLTVLWGAVFAPIAEELLFRGALWSWIVDLTQRFHRSAERDPLASFLRDDPFTRAARALKRWALTGGLATLLASALFAWMHADMKGGVGIVRVVSTFCLGLACGTARQLTSSVFAAILVHLTYNALSIGQTRRWWVVGGFTNYYGVSTLVSLLAAVCTAGIVVGLILLRLRRKRLQSTSNAA